VDKLTASVCDKHLGGLVGDGTRALRPPLTQAYPNHMTSAVQNVTGSCKPYRTAGFPNGDCRFAAWSAMVKSGLVDITFLMDAHCGPVDIQTCQAYTHSMGNVATRGVPTTAQTSKRLIDPAEGLPAIRGIRSGGIMMLISPAIQSKVIHTTHRCAGQLFLVHLRHGEDELIIVALYGVLAPQTDDKKSMRAQLAAAMTQMSSIGKTPGPLGTNHSPVFARFCSPIATPCNGSLPAVFSPPPAAPTRWGLDEKGAESYHDLLLQWSQHEHLSELSLGRTAFQRARTDMYPLAYAASVLELDHSHDESQVRAAAARASRSPRYTNAHVAEQTHLIVTHIQTLDRPIFGARECIRQYADASTIWHASLASELRTAYGRVKQLKRPALPRPSQTTGPERTRLAIHICHYWYKLEHAQWGSATPISVPENSPPQTPPRAGCLGNLGHSQPTSGSSTGLGRQ
jgi:hypothetical protein